MSKHYSLFAFIPLLLILIGCNPGEETAASPAPATQEVVAVTPTETPTATATSEPTATATNTPSPTHTATAEPTDTPSPTNTPAPSNTPTKQRPTSTPTRTPKTTPTPTTNGDKDNNSGADAGMDVFELITNAEAKVQALNTMNFSQNVHVETTGFAQDMVQTCAVQNPDQAYCLTEATITMEGLDPIESYNEVVQIGEQMWMREEGGEWEEMPPGTLDAMGFSEEGMQQLTLSEFILEATLAGETSIDDEPVYEIAFTLDVNAYWASILGEEMAELFTQSAEENSGYGTLWIGQEDSLTHKAMFQMTMLVSGEPFNMNSQVAYFGFNEPVEIPDPTAGE